MIVIINIYNDIHNNNNNNDNDINNDKNYNNTSLTNKVIIMIIASMIIILTIIRTQVNLKCKQSCTNMFHDRIDLRQVRRNARSGWNPATEPCEVWGRVVGCSPSYKNPTPYQRS